MALPWTAFMIIGTILAYIEDGNFGGGVYGFN